MMHESALKPVHDYGDPLAEHLAARKTCGLVDLSYRAKLRVTGPDRATYLQGLVTNDVVALREGAGLYTALLTVKGHLVGDFFVYKEPDAILLDMDADLVGKLFPILNTYLLTSDARLEDVSAQVGHLGLYGPSAGLLLQRLIGSAVLPEPEYTFVRVRVGEEAVMLIRHDTTGEVGYELLVPAAALAGLWSVLIEHGRAEGLVPIGLAAMETLRIEAGLPRYGVDMDEQHLPQEAGIEGRAVSFTKGCFLGQEPVSRIHYRGRTNRRLVGLDVAGETVPQRGDQILVEGKEVGTTTSAILSPSLGRIIALGYVHRDYVEPGTGVMIGERATPATVTRLPFYQPAG